MIDFDSFMEERKVVLTQWPTGADVNLEEAFGYQREIDDRKRFSSRLRKADENTETLLQPRAGVALVDSHIELLRFLLEEGSADLLPTTIDSYTRHNKYAEAE
ncbi:MAG: methylaspartate mutase subunit E, partial [Clostridia bacterium]|nr:methylaspartate mutase subunit E [Clostridia bacterium]